MIALIVLALLGPADIVGTIRTLPIDGYRRIPTVGTDAGSNRRVSR